MKGADRIIALGAAAIFTIMFAGTPGPVIAAEKGAQSAMERQAGQTQSMVQDVHRADRLIGSRANDQQGNDLGEIKDLVLDRNGRVTYLVISKSGTAGTGGNLVPVPYRRAGVNIQEDQVTLTDIDQAKLQNAPSFSENEWEMLRQSAFEQEVRGYFGSEAEPSDPRARDAGDIRQVPPAFGDPSSVTPQPYPGDIDDGSIGTGADNPVGGGM